MANEAVELPGMGTSLAVSLISLGLVCLLAYVTLRWLSRRGFGTGREGAIRVVARCPIEPRRSIYIVEAGGRFFLVGVGDGPMSLLAELGADAVARDAPAFDSMPAEVAAASRAGPGARSGAFARILARVPWRGVWRKDETS